MTITVLSSTTFIALETDEELSFSKRVITKNLPIQVKDGNTG